MRATLRWSGDEHVVAVLGDAVDLPTVLRVVDANQRTTWVHTGPSGDAWSSIVTCGPQDALTTSVLPGFSIRLSEIA